MSELELFLTLLKDAALSLGGLGALPLIRQDLVAPGLATDAQVVQALAIGRLSTGPTGLWIVSLGYFVAGVGGAALALVACCLPPLVMIPATAAARRYLLTSWFAGLVRGASLATAGLLLSVGLTLIVPDARAITALQLILGACAAVITYQGRIHPGLVVVGGAVVGVALAR
ncbi:MAG TPA: chromate transporter [Candidatus Limnocylindrales bacterium]|nr:chromate transporter [Candidatus Limnocylindrales bacterium]